MPGVQPRFTACQEVVGPTQQRVWRAAAFSPFACKIHERKSLETRVLRNRSWLLLKLAPAALPPCLTEHTNSHPHPQVAEAQAWEGLTNHHHTAPASFSRAPLLPTTLYSFLAPPEKNMKRPAGAEQSRLKMQSRGDASDVRKYRHARGSSDSLFAGFCPAV